MEGNMVVIKESKTLYFDFYLPKDVDKNFKHETEFVLKCNESLVEHKIKSPNISMEVILMNTENSETSEPHKFSFNLSQILDLRSSSKHVDLQNLSIYYKWQDMRKHYKNNKLKIIAPTRSDEFELPDGSYYVSYIQDYIEYIIKNMKN